MHHPLRFGINTIQNLDWPILVERWKHIEVLGYDSVWVADHILNPHTMDRLMLERIATEAIPALKAKDADRR